MAKLTSRKRDKLPSSDFAGPGRSYPIPDASHARAALARASHAKKVGRLSASQYQKIERKAHKMLGSRSKSRSKGRR